MRLTLLLFCAITASPASAAQFLCRGDPGWILDFDESLARFTFLGVTEMEVMLETRAEGADWPRAFTLVGERDTAIVLVENEICPSGGEAQDLPYRTRVFTQRGQRPILLTGCCEMRR
ncbi:MAG: hypothetical protein GY717_18655 [Rhodobacteraceae bacterium]|nr:hypothetical protein [Paracoccaceae bacterium]